MSFDVALTCTDCGAEFALSTAESDAFARVHRTPSRCSACRVERRHWIRNRELYTVTCSACSHPTEVPFQPRGDLPVYCPECFARSRAH